MNWHNSQRKGDGRRLWLTGLVAVAVLLAGTLGYLRLAGSEALFSNVLAATLGVSVVGGTIALCLLGVRRNREAHNEAAEQHDLALQQLARLMDWRGRPGTAHELPTAGRYEGWGTAVGMVDGFAVRVGVATDSPGEEATTVTTVVIVKPPSESHFSVGTNQTLKYCRKNGRLVGPKVSTLQLQELEPFASGVEVSMDCLTVTLAPPDRYFKGMSYVLATQSDVSTLRAALSASVRVAKRLIGSRPRAL